MSDTTQKYQLVSLSPASVQLVRSEAAKRTIATGKRVTIKQLVEEAIEKSLGSTAQVA